MYLLNPTTPPSSEESSWIITGYWAKDIKKTAILKIWLRQKKPLDKLLDSSVYLSYINYISYIYYKF